MALRVGGPHNLDVRVGGERATAVMVGTGNGAQRVWPNRRPTHSGTLPETSGVGVTGPTVVNTFTIPYTGYGIISLSYRHAYILLGTREKILTVHIVRDGTRMKIAESFHPENPGLLDYTVPERLLHMGDLIEISISAIGTSNNFNVWSGSWSIS